MRHEVRAPCTSRLALYLCLSAQRPLLLAAHCLAHHPASLLPGCIYSYQQTSIFLSYLNEKRQGNVADPGLKQALAASEDDGESSTAYEESKA